MQFTEKTRVQVPAIVHFTRLGFKYLSLKTVSYDRSNNIVDSLLLESLKKINPNIYERKLLLEIQSLKVLLKNNDLGKAYYERLIRRDGIRFVDFNCQKNNYFHVVYEYPFINSGEEFRPDITILINGLPLAFAEVKVPNNKDLIEAERFRMRERFSKPWFRGFMNGFQVLVFSNNMKYDDDSIVTIQGAFYSTTASKDIRFSTFREEDKFLYERVKENDIELETEQLVLIDTNSTSIRGTPEYTTNLKFDSPTNSILTSLFSKERFLYLLNYGICYVDEKNEDTGKTELKKHIMRYPQLFASKEITTKLENSIHKGIIWHTQGSGKTELAFYMNKILIDYYGNIKSNVKFFFIVDRIDLFKQASQEFIQRGLKVNYVENRDSFEDIIKSGKVIHNSEGKPEITVVNIQKFSEDAIVIKPKEYDTKIQRVYFIDESHRSYSAENRNGLVVLSKFLTQLVQSDKSAIHIGLTGTPIILEKINTTDLFGGYIHKYYYNQSIADGYTLRLFREEVVSTFVQTMKGKYDEFKIQNSKLRPTDIVSKPSYVKDLLEYISNDYDSFELLHNSPKNSLKFGSMIVCDSNDQAREIKKQLDEDYPKYSSLLILHNENTKEYREEEIKLFKKTNKYDLVIVDRMLLTGFDCPRLKRMYLLKVIRKHNLLQALTRVNRPFYDFKYGFIVDFADISEEFKKTNDSYLEELKREYGDEFSTNADIFITNEEISIRLDNIKEKLFNYDLENMEIFSSQVQDVIDKNELQQLSKLVEEAKDLYGVAKLNEQLNFFMMDIGKLNRMAIEIERAYAALRLKEALIDNNNYEQIIDITLEQIKFAFFKGKEGELKLGDQFFSKFRKAQESFRKNIDKNDPAYSELIRRLKALLGEKHFEEITEEKLEELEKLEKEIQKLNNKNQGVASKYNNDQKFLRIHKRLKEKLTSLPDIQLAAILNQIKAFFDKVVFDNEKILDNETLVREKLFDQVFSSFINNKVNFGTNAESTIDVIDQIIYNEYIKERRGYDFAGH